MGTGWGEGEPEVGVSHVQNAERQTAVRRREGLAQVRRMFEEARGGDGERLAGYALFTMPGVLATLEDVLNELDELRLWRDAIHRDVRDLALKTRAAYHGPPALGDGEE